MLQDNYLGRQIDMLARMLSMLLLKLDVSTYFDTADGAHALRGDAAAFFAELEALVAANDIGAAEDAVFDRLGDDVPPHVIQAALVFYLRLNGLRDKALEDGGFSKEEILDGLNEMREIFGIEAI